MKTCPNCKTEKDLDCFHKNKRLPLGVDCWCKPCKSEKAAKRYQKDKERIIEQQLGYYHANKETIIPKRKKYRKANKKMIRTQKTKYMRKRRRKDPSFRLLENLRRRHHNALNGNMKAASTIEMIGCTKEEAWEHLESQFTEGMTRENYGMDGWVVDHIIPLASFDLSKESEQKRAFHYTNTQPLWWLDNLLKSDKMPDEL